MKARGDTGGQSLVRLAPAKLNLTLDVLGTRPDGYHEIRSAMVAVSLFDRLEVRASDHLVVDNPAVPPEEDLILAAARRLREEGGVRAGAQIQVTKEIPLGAGLGGGSSDAAAALLLLNDLWRTGADIRDLMRLGAGLGSDVPFFLAGRPAVVGGRGDEILGTFEVPDVTFVILKPPPGLDTRQVYARCRAGDGRRTDLFLAAREAGEVVFTGNDLEASAREILPALGDLFTVAAPHDAHLTGSGSALFVAFSDPSQAADFSSRFFPPVFVRTVRPLEEMPVGRANASTGRP